MAYQSARSKLDLPVEHFRSLVLRCVGDKDHSKIFDIVAEVEKVAKTATLDSEKRVAYRSNPQNNYTPQAFVVTIVISGATGRPAVVIGERTRRKLGIRMHEH